MASTSYETLTIKIEADSKQANSNVKNLSNNLRQLDKSAKELDTRRLGEVRGLLLHIAKIDFSNVSQGLRDVVKAFNAFNSKKFMNATNNGANLSGAYKTDPNTFLNLDNVAKNLDLSSPISVADQAIQQYKQHLQELSDNANKGDWFKNFNAGLQETDVNSANTQETVKQVASSLKKLEKESQKTSKSLGHLAKDFARILKYRILRKIIQEVYQALVQGTQNIIAFDNATAESFNNIMNSLVYLTNALGAVISPLLQVVEPVLTMLIDLSAEASNALAELFAEMNGQNMFASATKGAEDYASALKKTKSIGIDELNIIGQDSKQGNFEYKEVEDGVEGLSNFKDLLTTVGGLVADILRTIAPVVKMIFKLLGALSPLVIHLLEIVQNIWDELAPTLVSIIGTVVDLVIALLPVVDEIVSILEPIIVSIVQLLKPVVEMIDIWIKDIFNVVKPLAEVAKVLVGVVGAILTPISVVLTIITTIFYVLEGIYETFKKMFTFNFAGIGETWKDVGKKIADAWAEMGKANGEMFGTYITGYATGGFPEDGLFMANHNELVGQFSNGQTAVANNEQITQGIYQAVLQAMRESGGSNGEIVINLDGYEMARVITNKQNNFGQDLVIGGNINYGK